jgi:GNAT superfamily N-acetyltransferase
VTGGWRVAGETDVAELVRVINLAYRVEDFFIEGDRTDRSDVLERLRRPGAEFLVVDAGEPNRLAAAVYLEQRGDRGYFGLLSVDPTVQRRGLGRRLVAAVEERCRDRGCLALDINVVDLRLELPAFYAELGFEPAGTAPFKDVDKLKRPAVMLLMSKSLES